MTFNELIKSKGYSIYTLATKMKKSHATIYRWATGKNEPNCKCIVELSKILKVSIKDLVLMFANKEVTQNE